MALQNTDELVELVAEGAKALKSAEADGKLDVADLGYLLPVIQKVPAAFAGANLILGEIEAADAASIKAEAEKLLLDLGLSGKISVYVEEAFNIMVSVYRVIKA